MHEFFLIFMSVFSLHFFFFGSKLTTLNQCIFYSSGSQTCASGYLDQGSDYYVLLPSIFRSDYS